MSSSDRRAQFFGRRTAVRKQWNWSTVAPVFHISALSATLVLYSSVVLFCSFVLVLPKLEELNVSQSVPLDTCKWQTDNSIKLPVVYSLEFKPDVLTHSIEQVKYIHEQPPLVFQPLRSKGQNKCWDVDDFLRAQIFTHFMWTEKIFGLAKS